MAGLNQVNLIGHLGKDPELRTMANSDTVCSFSLATSEQWKDRQTGEKKSRTEWHNIVVWGPLSKVCAQYLKKGSQVYIGGKLRTREWEKDGVKRYITEVFCDDMTMLGSKDGAQRSTPATNSGGAAANNSGFQSDTTSGVDDLPF